MPGALLLAMMSIAGLALAAGRSTLSEHIDFEKKTTTHEFEVNVPEGAAAARLQIRTRVKAGEVRWILTDSEGAERLTGSCQRGSADGDTGEIVNPKSGVWSLEIALEEATGRYYVDWVSE